MTVSIVTAKRLNDYMSSPEWTPEQTTAVQDVLDGLERELESALYGAWITPRRITEVAPILRSGLVATTQVVHTLHRIGDVVVDDAHPPVLPWVLRDHRLRTLSPGSPPASFTLGEAAGWGSGRADTVDSVGRVVVDYDGGWGEDPALVLAILRKAANWANNWTEDSIRITDTDGATPPPMTEEWTADELAALGVYRNLTAVRRGRP